MGVVLLAAAALAGAAPALAIPPPRPQPPLPPALPVGPPYAGQLAADFPQPVWAEANGQGVWLDAKRERYTPICRPLGAGLVCPIASPPPFDPRTQVTAALTVKRGDRIRFHLPAAPAARPTLVVGGAYTAPPGDLQGGRTYSLGGTDAPWWTVTRATRSGLAALTTSTGTYWLRLAVRR